VAADGKTVERCDPWFFDCRAVHVVRHRVGSRHAAEKFVHEAEIAPQKPGERDEAAIEMRQVDAGAEQSAAAIFRVLDLAAAQHRDVGGRIEDRDIDGDLHGVERGVVLGIEKARIAGGDERSLAPTLDLDLAEIDAAYGVEFAQELRRGCTRQQHRVAQVAAGRFVREHMGEENALVDFDAVLVALQVLTFGGDLFGGRCQAGHRGSGSEYQIF
jgi:hypothetical protein